MATSRRAGLADRALSAPVWAVVWWFVITVCVWLIGALLSHPWAALFFAPVFAFFARDYIEGKSLWTLVAFGCWIAGIALNHPWIGFIVGFVLTVGVCGIVYQ
jgi:hypothetical protein